MNDLQSLSQIYQNKLFRIPDYQRGYAWKQEQLVDFWDDMANLQSERYHYTGLLSLKAVPRSESKEWNNDKWLLDSGYKAYHVVDGQQRLTTFSILINEIVDFVKNLECNAEKSEEDIVLCYQTLKAIRSKYISQKRPPQNLITTYLFGYETDNPSADYLTYKVFCEPFSGSVDETYYTQNLKKAKDFFTECLRELYISDGIEGIENVLRKLTLQLMFNIHEIEDDYDVFVAFETMNNRGKKLTNLELLKNRLIYLTTLYSDKKFDELDKANIRKQINNAWKEVYYQLGRNEKTPLSDDEFLRAHWISYFAYSRRKGDDYIHFLLNKFSAKNIFEKKTLVVGDTTQEVSDDIEYDADIETEEDIEPEAVEISKLEPREISDYVNSLKDTAQYWYDTFFPLQSDNLSAGEKVWVDRLNRIGIGHFRPLVMVIISDRDLSAKKRIEAFKAIERFLFICFRMGYFNATFRSSEYYRATRSICLKQMGIDDLIDDINETTNANIEYALPNFVTKIEKHFDNMGGFYYWNSIKYFLYEYEFHLSKKNNIDKVSWEMFTKTEKDKVSIEHILPQTPTKYYWRNQFRQFDDEEIELLSCALGNLLPLSQSINSALQNDSFEDKKTSKSTGRRGYQNGSHSEIEVSKETEWTAERIYQRSKMLLQFMENRWEFSFNKEQLEKLVYVSFAVDGREIPHELAKEEQEETDAFSKKSSKAVEYIVDGTELENKRMKFWTNFVNYCKQEGYGETVALRKPSSDGWYAVSVGTADLHIEFTITRSKFLAILIYAENSEVFLRLESKKEEIEEVFGDKLDWYSSREKSNAKRILFKRECEVFNPEKQDELFAWMLDKFDELYNALVKAGELAEESKPIDKFATLKQYLLSENENEITLSFAEIESIIGMALCKSAYTYSAYWQSSPTHSMPNTILAAGYKVASVDFFGKRIVLEKQHNLEK